MASTEANPEHQTTPVVVAPPAAPAVAPSRPFWRRPIGAVVGVVLLVGIAIGVYYWVEARGYETTDDAFVDGNAIPVSSKVLGTVSQVLVNDNQDVAAGELLLTIDPKDIEAQLVQAQASLEAAKSRLVSAQTQVELTKANTAASLSQAEAGVTQAQAAVTSSESQLASAQADVTAAQAEADRRSADYQRFVSADPRGVSKAQLDAARAASESANASLNAAQKRVAGAQSSIAEAKAKVEAARAVQSAAQTAPQQIAAAEAQAKTAQAAIDEQTAAVRELSLQRSYTSVYAPTAGRVTRKNVQIGQNVQPNQSLLAIVQRDVWVVANFKETQLAHMSRGQAVDIEVDAYPGRIFHGKIDSVQAGTGSRFSMLPAENATGNYVKVVQRVPVKITFDNDQSKDLPLLSLGMSVAPRVHIATGGDNAAPLPINPPLAATTRPAAEKNTDKITDTMTDAH